MAELDESHIPTFELINAEISARLTRQDAAGSQIDTKAAFLAGVAATAAQFLAGRKDPSALPGLAQCAYAAYTVAFLCAVGAYALARYKVVPEPVAFANEFAWRPKQDALADLIATKANTFEENKGKYRRKVHFWWASVLALTLGLVLSVTAIAKAPTPLHTVPPPVPAAPAQPAPAEPAPPTTAAPQPATSQPASPQPAAPQPTSPQPVAPGR